ncbi:MAG: ABC transporter ATP-binding protein [Verrucomicrobia bacterium]|nr:ABC transporter ATP-binding protein [Verrucomicrobiota bacterium]
METWVTYRRLLAMVRPYRGRLAVGLLMGLLVAASNPAMVVIVQKVLAKVFTPERDLTAWQIAAYAALVPVVFVARGAVTYLNGYLMNWVGLRVVMDLRNQLFAHLQTLSLDFYTQTRIGDMMSRVTNDSEVVRRSVSVSLADLLREPFSIIGLLGTLFWYDWKFTMMALVVFPLCVVPIGIYGRKVRRATRRTQENLAELTGLLHENFTGVRIVKAFCMEQHEIGKFRQSTQELIRQMMRVVRANETLTPVIEFLGAFAVAGVFLYAYTAGMTGDMFGALGMGMYMLYQPVKKLSKVHLTLEQSVAAAERIFKIVDLKPTVTDRPGARELPPVREKIVFEDVSFRYHDHPVLENINVTVPVGSVLAVVGPTGSGKTTLLNLLPRFYDPTRGRVLIDGHDLRDVTLRSLRSQIGMVTQETILFDDTVASNIAYGRPDAPREAIIEAARRAHADDFIRHLPRGYDTVVGDKGMRLSGGERQRVAIARALLKNPPLLILDEATSALDSKTEKLVQEAIDELMRGRTVFAIAHRLSTIQHADRILVLEQGRIVESGSHAELLAHGGIYKRLYDQQFNA